MADRLLLVEECTVLIFPDQKAVYYGKILISRAGYVILKLDTVSRSV